MRLLLASVLLALVSGLAAQSVVIEVDRPVTGHFWALGPLPLDTPPILVGEGGVRAYRIQAIGQHSAIYGLESFAELLPRDGVVKLEPAASGDPVALWWAHPAVLDDLGAVAGAARVGGVWSPSPRIALEVDGEHRKRFSCEHRCGDYAVRLWFDVFARSPVVQVVGFIARLDRRPELGVEVELAFGEEASVAHDVQKLTMTQVGGGPVPPRQPNVHLYYAASQLLKPSLKFAPAPRTPAGVARQADAAPHIHGH